MKLISGCIRRLLWVLNLQIVLVKNLDVMSACE